MFENVGSKIKAWAKVILVLGTILSLAGGTVFLVLHPSNRHNVELPDVILCIVTIVIGFLLSWFAALHVYAYGENNENLKRLVRIKNSENQENNSSIHTKADNSPRDTYYFGTQKKYPENGSPIRTKTDNSSGDTYYFSERKK